MLFKYFTRCQLNGHFAQIKQPTKQTVTAHDGASRGQSAESRDSKIEHTLLRISI